MPAAAVHRVIGIEGEKGELAFVTKGDNSDVDPFKVPASAVRGAVVKNLGPWGRPILFLTNRAILLILGLPILTFALIVLATLWMTPSEKGQVSGAAPTAKRANSATDAAGAIPRAIGLPLDRLTSAVSKYGVHLQSHTSIVKRMAGSSDRLEEAVHQQNEVLAELAAVVREMKYYQGQNGEQVKPQAPGNGHMKSSNGNKSKDQTSGNGKKKSRNGSAKTGPVNPM